MQQACDNKEKIDKQWRYEISYFCKWITGEVIRFCYSPSRDEKKGVMTDKEVIKMLDKCSHIRKMYEMRQAFITATKVLDGIFTDEEKAQHKENEKEMIKMVREVINQHKTDQD
jgi:hypothetical protein